MTTKTINVAELVKFAHWVQRNQATDKLDLFRQVVRQLIGDKKQLIGILTNEEYATYENAAELGKAAAESLGYNSNDWLCHFVDFAAFGKDYADEHNYFIYKLKNGSYVELFFYPF